MKSIEKLKIEVQKRMKKNDPAHDFEHIMRVYKNAQRIGKKEKVNMKRVLTAVLLHDIISYPKSGAKSKTSSTKSALEAQKMLKKHGYSEYEIKTISEAIRDHSFSRGVVPQSMVGKVLQDADRLDAIGVVGVARAFAMGGAEKRPFYNKADPFCQTRKPDDQNWTLDHFYKKLLLLEKKMNTKAAKIEARRRTKLMKKFLNDFKKEI